MIIYVRSRFIYRHITTLFKFCQGIYRTGNNIYYRIGYIVYVKQIPAAPIEFLEKIKSKMVLENLGVTQLAKKLGVSHPTVIDVITHGKRPSVDTCLALAKWLGQSDISVLREVGWLQPGPANETRFDDWKYLLDQMPLEEQEELRQIAQMKIERRKKAEDAKRAVNLKPRKAGNG